MKQSEIKVEAREDRGELTIRRAKDEGERLSANQRFILLLALIGAVVWIAATVLIGRCGFFGGVFLATFCIVRSYGKIDF